MGGLRLLAATHIEATEPQQRLDRVPRLRSSLQRTTVLCGAIMINAAEPAGYRPLDLQANPFGSNSYAFAPVSSAQAALKEVIEHIGLRRRAIIIAGGAGTGKTFLLKMIVRSCSDMGLSVCQFDRGDLADTTIDARSDVVLVDEADSIPDSAVLTLLFRNPSNTATTWVFMCLPSSVHRFGCLDVSVVELRGLSVDDARTYLLERATSIGRPNLFAPDALDLIVHQARESPRLLLSVASLAFFTAGWGRATQIGVRHVAYWLESQISLDFVEDSGAPHGGVFRRESANHTKAKHSSAYERDMYRSILGPIGALIPLLLKRVPRGRALRLTGATAAIAGSIAVVAFLVGSNDAIVETSVTVPLAPNLVAADVSPVQTPTTPISPDIRTSASGDAAEPTSVNAPGGKATAALNKRDPTQVGQPRVAPKRTGPPRPMKTARLAQAPKSASSPAATKKEAQRARDTVHVARKAEEVARRTADAALQAQHAAHQANEAARRAERAARRADQAANQAERAARQANWGFRIQFPWKAITQPRSAS